MSDQDADHGVSVPRHVAIIMDGNGRWAKKKALPRVAGHRAGAEAVRTTLRAAVEAGVECLTLYAFSSENWRRSDEEIGDLKGLMGFYLEREIDELEREGVRLSYVGDPSRFGDKLWQRLQDAAKRTEKNDRLRLVVALNYGSQAELTDVARKLAQDVADGKLAAGDIDEQAIASRLDTHDLPPLDLLIRTSGEVRLSNFLLWQAAYAELMFLDCLWPDFDKLAFMSAIDTFKARQRRFGGR